MSDIDRDFIQSDGIDILISQETLTLLNSEELKTALNDTTDLFYHLHDEDSLNAMGELAKSHDEEQSATMNWNIPR